VNLAVVDIGKPGANFGLRGLHGNYDGSQCLNCKPDLLRLGLTNKRRCKLQNPT